MDGWHPHSFTYSYVHHRLTLSLLWLSVPPSLLRRKGPASPEGGPASVSTLGTRAPGLVEWATLTGFSGSEWCSHFLRWTFLWGVPERVWDLWQAPRQEPQNSKVSSVFPGQLSIKPSKTSEPEETVVGHLGMIAGGTGRGLLGLHPQRGSRELFNCGLI